MKCGFPKVGMFLSRRLAVVVALFALGHRTAHAAGTSSIPLSYYETNGLIPVARRPSRGKPVEAVAPDVTKTYEAVPGGPGPYEIDLQTAAEVLNTRIVLENRGRVDIVNPWVVVNGKRDWFDLASLAKDAAGGETDPERKAFRIWRFVRDNRYHDTPAEEDGEIHDPVKMFNVYGYGLCDDAAINLETLWMKSGFQYARRWFLEGHVVPEVYYNSRYHMFDADLQVFYPRWGSHDVAGAEDCAEDGGLVERISGAGVAEIYTTVDDNTVYSGGWTTGHTMAMTLRPGEMLERYWQGWGAFHSTIWGSKPPALIGNGRLTYSLPLADPDVARQGLREMTNIGVVPSVSDVNHLGLVDPAKPGQAVLQMRSPYVFVSGRLEVVARLDGATDVLGAEFSRDGVAWTKLGSRTGPMEGPWEIYLDSAIQPHTNVGCYEFRIRLTLSGKTTKSAVITQWLTVGDIQCSPLALPGLEPSRVNTVEVRYTAPPEARLAVIHDYQVLTASPTDPEANLNTPVIQLSAAKPASFSWSLPSPLVEGFEAMVTRDREGVLCAAPPLWQWTGTASQWSPNTEFLLPGGKYWWVVRYRDTAGNWRRWSTPQPFIYASSSAAQGWREYE